MKRGYAALINMLEIDGSHGEGGGQILRTALALSIITRKPFRIVKIRANRRPPGLRPQHLAAVKAAAAVGAAQTSGAAVDSATLTFAPSAVCPGTHYFDVGTAGSTTLVLQTVLPPLMLATQSSSLRLVGGTHNPFAPPFHFLQAAFLPVLARMGVGVSAGMLRPGLYPRGGGELAIDIEPAGALKPILLLERGPLRRRTLRIAVARLSRQIAEREATVVRAALELRPDEIVIEEWTDAFSPGNVAMLEWEYENLSEVVTAFGERGHPAEQVAANLVSEAVAYLSATWPVAEHLADQLILPLALAGCGEFRTGPLSRHSKTNLDVIQVFLGERLAVEAGQHGDVVIRATPARNE